jgi:hypothetical protein
LTKLKKVVINSSVIVRYYSTYNVYINAVLLVVVYFFFLDELTFSNLDVIILKKKMTMMEVVTEAIRNKLSSVYWRQC